MKYTLEKLNKMVDEANERGGSLDLSSLTSIPEGFNPTVGGYLYLRSNLKCKVKVNHFTQGQYVSGDYLYADGILTHVKRKRTNGKYTYFQGKIPGRNVIFDGKHYAHCKSFKEGVIDLNFKECKDRGADQYNNLTLDSTVTKEEAIMMYRIITGACRQGTEQFLSTIPKFKKSYTVRELIEITKGQYGAATFADFFERER